MAVDPAPLRTRGRRRPTYGASRQRRRRRLAGAAVLAAVLGLALYLVGVGGSDRRARAAPSGSRVRDRVVSRRPVGRWTRLVVAGTATLPAQVQDAVAAAAGGGRGGTAYVVGGYTGAGWLDTIVAWRPRGGSRVVAHLPFGVCYAAVTAVGRRLLIAGGSLPNGRASRAVFEFVPASGRVFRSGLLP